MSAQNPPGAPPPRDNGGTSSSGWTPPPSDLPPPPAPQQPVGQPPAGGMPPPSGWPAAPVGFGQVQATTQALRAGFWRRLLAFIIDTIVLGIVDLIIRSVIDAVDHGTTSLQVISLIEFLVGLVYFTWLWARYGRTVGYAALGMRLTTTAGQPVGAARAAVRYILIEVSFALFLIPAIISAFMIGLSGSKQALHDKIVDTVVVRT
jgi:uncharacterized RDD family membrane protein YckC